MELSTAVPAHGSLLLVEDDEAFARVLSRALQQHGFSVNVASAADDALALALRVGPAYVLLDLNLGGPQADRAHP